MTWRGGDEEVVAGGAGEDDEADLVAMVALGLALALFAEICFWPFAVRTYSAFCNASNMLYHEVPRLPAKKSALAISTFKQAMLRSDKPGD